MKTIVAVVGSSKAERHTAIVGIYDTLLLNGGIPLLYERVGKYIYAKLNYREKRIGILSMGEPSTGLDEYLMNAAKSRSDIIVCGSHTKGGSVEGIEKVSHKFGYEVVWTTCFSGGTNSTLLNGLNLKNEFAETIRNLISKLN